MFADKMSSILFAPWATYTVYTASKLKIFNFLAVRPMKVEELAEAVGAVPRFLKALLDACAVMGFLLRRENTFENSRLSSLYLVEGNPYYLGDIIEVLSIEAESWKRLYDLMKKGEDADILGTESETEPHRFTMGMNNLALIGEADALAQSLNLSGVQKMADVGCGSGIYSIILCRRFPELQAVLLDKPEVLKTTREMIKKSNLQHRIRMRPVDITIDAYGRSLDLVLISDVLYYEKSICFKVLRSALRSLSQGGLLVVRGYYSEPGGSDSLFGSLFNLGRLLFDPTREILTISLLTQWLNQLGFQDIDTFPLTEMSTCFIARKGVKPI